MDDGGAPGAAGGGGGPGGDAVPRALPVRWHNPAGRRAAYARAHGGSSGPRGAAERARAATLAAARPDVSAAHDVRAAHLRAIRPPDRVGDTDLLVALRGSLRVLSSRLAAVGARVAGLGPKPPAAPRVAPAVGGGGAGGAAAAPPPLPGGAAVGTPPPAAVPAAAAAAGAEPRAAHSTARRALRAHASALQAHATVLRRRAKGAARLALTSGADQLTRGVSMVVVAPFRAREWAKSSGPTAHDMNLGEVLPRLANAAVRQGVAMPAGTEQYSTGKCGRCGAFEPRGSATRVDCAVCGARTARDAGGAPSSILLRNAVHAVQARAAASLLAAGRGIG